MARSLTTPDSIRSLQRKLYCKAKAEPAFRFYLLYDKIYRKDILAHAYALARANGGAPGVDGMTFAMIEVAGLEEWLAEIRKDLIAKTYRPAPVRRVMIPKPGGGAPNEVKPIELMSSPMPTTSLSSATDMRMRHWRGRGW